jgi:hypothetical protein
MQKVKTTNLIQIWSKNLRPRVGDTVSIDGSEYTNLTGSNSDPLLNLGDWKELPKTIEVFEKDIVEVYSKDQIINQPLLSNKVYKLEFSPVLEDGEFIEAGDSLTFKGNGFNVTTLSTVALNGVIFKSKQGGSGDVILQEMQVSAFGVNSQVFDLEDNDGSHAIELEYVNFTGSKSLGRIKGYRQGTGTALGFYGCLDGLQLAGQWSGFKISNSNLFGFASSGTLIKKDVDTSFSNRLFINLNFDVPTGSKITDLGSDNFEQNELFQLNSCIAKVNGVISIDNAETLAPNITANDEKSLWIGNIGLPDTATEVLVDDNTVSGTFTIDWLKDTFNLTMVGDTVFTEKNLPASGKNTQEIKIYLTGDFIPTFPSNWIVNSVGSYKGADLNEIRVKYLKNGLYFLNISNSLSVYPRPFVTNITPAGILPNQTKQITINGLYFTPATVVRVPGLTVNTISFISPEEIKISLTAGAIESSYNLIVDNGTQTQVDAAILVNNGNVVVPQEAEFIERSNVDVDNGYVANNDVNSNGYTKWSRVFTAGQLFTLQFRPSVNALKFEPGGANRIYFYNASDGAQRRRHDISRNPNGSYYIATNVAGATSGGYVPDPNIVIRQTADSFQILDSNNNVLISKSVGPINSDFRIGFTSDNMDFNDIKFIEQ